MVSSGPVGAKIALVCLTLRFEQLKPEHGGFERGLAEATCTPAYAHCSCTVSAVDAGQALGGKQRVGRGSDCLSLPYVSLNVYNPAKSHRPPQMTRLRVEKFFSRTVLEALVLTLRGGPQVNRFLGGGRL